MVDQKADGRIHLRPRSIATLAMTIGILGISLFPARSDGALLRSLTLDPQSRALAATYDSAAYFKSSNSAGQTVWGSGVLLDPTHILTAAHQVPSPTSTGTIFFAGNGSNYNSLPGSTSTVTGWTRHPSYVANNGNTIDLAVVTLATPIGSRALSIASATVGESLTAVGFGRYGDPTTGALPSDGNARGWAAPVMSFMTTPYSSVYYQEGDFSPDVSLALNGKALSGDSGGPWFNSAGGLVGISVYQTGDTFNVGATTFVRLANPEISAWIATQVPEPTLGVLLGVFAAAARRRTSR